MKYVALTVAKTGPNISKHQIIAYACVGEDRTKKVKDLPYISGFIREILPDSIEWDTQTLNNHYNSGLLGDWLERNSEGRDCVSRTKLMDFLTSLSYEAHNKVILVNDNLIEDFPFINEYLRRYRDNFNTKHIDPTSAFIEQEDTEVPSLRVCLERCGESAEDIDRSCLERARMIITLVRKGIEKEWTY